MDSEQLRYKMKHLGVLCPNRSVANDEQFYELYSKFKDVIEDTEYNIDMSKDEIHCHHWKVSLYEINCVDLLTKGSFLLLFRL